MRVIQIGVDVIVNGLTDIGKLKKAVADAVNSCSVGVVGIEQSDTSWSLEDYFQGKK